MASRQVNDTNVCPSQGMGSDAERLKREQDRVSGHAFKFTPASGASEKPIEPFHLTVETLPAAPGQPVVVAIDGKTVYDSGSTDGDVSAQVEVPVEDLRAPMLTVNLKIGVMGFDRDFEVNRKDGHYFKLIGSDQGLQKKQQDKPW
eukprot:TRINITY_DN1326_c0_g1_i1.p1 TRINITY_DN1326_c0_g1~~TRINITY_DN1326_c0_g1_i1.p1  ORF type:complete len:146 (-),score=24.20 TRINITY_DN1326_c0_g1_i1:56-493(-)